MHALRFRSGSKKCLLLIVLTSIQYGCANHAVVAPGDRVALQFTCTRNNGEVMVSSEPGVARDALRAKAAVFQPRDSAEPLEVVASLPESAAEPRDFEADVIQAIAERLPGWTGFEDRTLELPATPSLYGEREGKLKLPRVRQRGKEIKVSVEDFASHTGRQPEAGDRLLYEEEFPCEVSSVAEGIATLTFTGQPGSVIATRQGPALLRDAGERIELVAQNKPGDLVRMGPLVARVIAVDDSSVEYDFSRTFAGETLHCQVRTGEVRAANSAEKDGSATAAPAGAPVETQSPVAAVAAETASSSTVEKVIGAEKADDSGASQIGTPAAPAAKSGDLATVRFSVRSQDGTPLQIDAAALPDGPVEMVAGSPELFPGLGEAVLGMTAGSRKQLTLTPEQGFGLRDPGAVASFPVRQSVPRSSKISADEYLKRFRVLPVLGQEVPLAPYLKAQVSAVGERDVEIVVNAKDGERFEEPFGSVEVQLQQASIDLVLSPRLGAVFSTGERQGKIIANDGVSFKVDFNHPLAGKTLVLDLELVSLAVPDAQAAPISWLEDHDLALRSAKEQNKPLFLMLYADWCGWCKKTLTDSIPDPRVQRLKDRFVWAKVNSDKEQRYKKLYGQDGYPLMLVLNADGSVLKRIDGYRDARSLAAELKQL